MNTDTKAVAFRALTESELDQATGGSFLLGLAVDTLTKAAYDRLSNMSVKTICELIPYLK